MDWQDELKHNLALHTKRFKSDAAVIEEYIQWWMSLPEDGFSPEDVQAAIERFGEVTE